MRTALILMVILGVSACGPTTEDLMAEVAVEELKAALRDPGSLQVSETKISVERGWGAICGRYNAANGFGGMAGPERFVRVFSPEELESLSNRDGKSREPHWSALQTKYRYDEEREAKVSLLERKEPTRGLFLEGANPILALRYTANHCVTGAEPIEVKP